LKANKILLTVKVKGKGKAKV